MSEAEMILLVKKAMQMMRDVGQRDSDIVIEIRRGEPKHVRFDLEVVLTEQDIENALYGENKV